MIIALLTGLFNPALSTPATVTDTIYDTGLAEVPSAVK